MSSGITLTRKEPLFSSTFTRRPDGIVEERRLNLKDEEMRVRTTLYYGGLIAFELKTRGGATLRSEFAEEASLPSLASSPGEYELAEVTYADGKRFAEAKSTITVGKAGSSVSIGDCRYTTRKIRVASKVKILLGPAEELLRSFEYDYSVELGTVIRTVEFGDENFRHPAAIVEYDTITADGL